MDVCRRVPRRAQASPLAARHRLCRCCDARRHRRIRKYDEVAKRSVKRASGRASGDGGVKPRWRSQRLVQQGSVSEEGGAWRREARQTEGQSTGIYKMSRRTQTLHVPQEPPRPSSFAHACLIFGVLVLLPSHPSVFLWTCSPPYIPDGKHTRSSRARTLSDASAMHLHEQSAVPPKATRHYRKERKQAHKSSSQEPHSAPPLRRGR